MRKIIFLSFFFSLHINASITPDWRENTPITTPRENIYQYSPEEFPARVMEGRKHALFYPVTAGSLFIPYKPLKTVFNSDPNHPVRSLLMKLARVVSPFKSMQDMYQWLGLHPFPSQAQRETPNPLPELSAHEKTLPMGATLIRNHHGEGLTFGCAACHTGNLFGTKVLGLTNRFPRANEFFQEGSKLAPYINSFAFRAFLGSTEGERLMFREARETIKHVGAKTPAQYGLDTSLAQLGLSLSKRGVDEYASYDDYFRRHPRPNKLSTMVADSKPAVWWNLKYKNKWLSDGSIVSGNPIFTNFLWNELGRGTDLHKLEQWMKENQRTIETLTAAVFASQAPRYEKFFGVEAIDIEKAKRGQKHFVQSCKSCHGSYQKAWEEEAASVYSKEALLQTVRVIYPKNTKVYDVGTDPGRYLGMREFADDLNRLRISKVMGTVVVPQEGYVPPPLVGIWARWPYFHNNSVPNLYAVLTASDERPKTYWAGEANDKRTDYDSDLGGYPVGAKTPAAWKKDKIYFYDTSREGLGNRGHDEGIFLENGQELYTREQKLELVEFLKTL